jgi:predicted transglutaminase-like cysteine proteinase
MTLEEFNKKYEYIKDSDKYNTEFDIWELPKEINGKIKGDCESYCRFLKNNVSEFKDYDYHYCKLNGNGHCLLYKNGDVIDCNIKRIVTLEQYNRMYKVTEFRKYSKIQVAIKIAFTNIYLLLNKLIKS